MQGNALAQNQVGVMLFTGRGVTKSLTEAVKWYKLAANQGNVEAQYNLACMYRFGYGVIQNYSEAKKWYILAATQGDAYAKEALADLENQYTQRHN